MNKKVRQPIIAFLVCSVLFHILVWRGLGFLHYLHPRPVKAPPIEITIVNPEDQLKKKSTKTKISQQIVEQDLKPINDEIPENARFLSRNNQKVVRETRAATSGKFANTAQKTTSRPSSNSTQKKSQTQKTSNSSKGYLPSLAALKPQYALTPPTPAQLDMDLPEGDPSQTDDYLKDTNIGIQTLLSTKEFVYYSYYNRIKEKIRQHWEPSVRENIKMAVRRGRSLASARDRITRVLITLDKNGSLIQVQVLGQSGLVELDSAAVDAFRAAAPFPNPPQGMVEHDGNIRIRWDFILEASLYYPLPKKNKDKMRLVA